MSDEIAHMRVIDGPLGLGLPCVIGLFVVGEDADDVQIADVLELGFRRINQFATKDEMQAIGHWDLRSY